MVVQGDLMSLICTYSNSSCSFFLVFYLLCRLRLQFKMICVIVAWQIKIMLLLRCRNRDIINDIVFLLLVLVDHSLCSFDFECFLSNFLTSMLPLNRIMDRTVSKNVFIAALISGSAPTRVS